MCNQALCFPALRERGQNTLVNFVSRITFVKHVRSGGYRNGKEVGRRWRKNAHVMPGIAVDGKREGERVCAHASRFVKLL